VNENKTLVVVAGKRRYARRSERAELVAACESSGLSVAAFAAQRGLHKQALYRWRSEERRVAARRAVSLVEVPAPKMASAWAAEVMTTHGPVRLSLGATPSWAGELIRELRRC
jgi:transposase-like protein